MQSFLFKNFSYIITYILPFIHIKQASKLLQCGSYFISYKRRFLQYYSNYISCKLYDYTDCIDWLRYSQKINCFCYAVCLCKKIGRLFMLQPLYVLVFCLLFRDCIRITQSVHSCLSSISSENKAEHFCFCYHTSSVGWYFGSGSSSVEREKNMMFDTLSIPRFDTKPLFIYVSKKKC